jgi:hypothetical protein
LSHRPKIPLQQFISLARDNECGRRFFDEGTKKAGKDISLCRLLFSE